MGYDEYAGILSVTSELSEGLDVNLYSDRINKPERMEVLRCKPDPNVTPSVTVALAGDVKSGII